MLDSFLPYNATRRALYPAIDRFKRAVFGGYAVGDTTADEYAVTILEPKKTVERTLVNAGFTRNLASALKIRPDGDVSDGSWVYRESLLADDQLHFVLHTGDGEWVDVYAHTERSWIRHPVGHYRKERYSTDEGVEMAQNLFEESDLECAVQPRYRRDEKWLLYALYLVNESAAARLRSIFDAVYEWLPVERSGGKPNLPFLADELES